MADINLAPASSSSSSPSPSPAARVLDGKALAARVRAEQAARCESLKALGVTPTLAVVLVGDDPASQIYVRGKVKACRDVGIVSRRIGLPAETSQADLEAEVDALNRDKDVHGILVQFPLPAGLDPRRIIRMIDPAKDVDGLTPVSAGCLMEGKPGFVPCTPKGVMRLLDEAGCDPAGKRAVVVGRSDLVGKPVALLLLHRNATVTMCHSRTVGLADETRRADILVAAAGRANLITGDMIKPGAVVIDVGVNRVEGEKKLYGDVEFESASRVASAITPVPGGVGPMTIAMLMANTLDAAGCSA